MTVHSCWGPSKSKWRGPTEGSTRSRPFVGEKLELKICKENIRKEVEGRLQGRTEQRKNRVGTAGREKQNKELIFNPD